MATTRKSNTSKKNISSANDNGMASDSNRSDALAVNPDTFLDERNDVLSVINDLEDQLDQYQALRESLEKELTQKTSDLQNAGSKVQELEWKITSMQSRLDAAEAIKGDVALLEEELDDQKAQIQRLTDQVSQDEREKARLSGELKSANKQLEEFWAVRKERDTLRSDISNLKSKLESSERDRRDSHTVRSQLEDKIHTFESTVEDLRKQKDQLEIDLRSANDRARDLEEQSEDLDSKLEAQREEKQGLETQLAHLERENQRLSEQRQFYECELISLRNMNRNAETALTSVKKAFGEVRIALSETKARVRRRSITSGRLGRADAETIELPTTVQLDTETVLSHSDIEAERPAEVV
jgi:exonuclease SbcC